MAAGFAGPTEAAERFHWNKTTYTHHEAGRRPRGIMSKVREYARAFRVDPSWILFETGRGPTHKDHSKTEKIEMLDLKILELALAYVLQVPKEQAKAVAVIYQALYEKQQAGETLTEETVPELLMAELVRLRELAPDSP
jgi:hypothetical protein